LSVTFSRYSEVAFVPSVTTVTATPAFTAPAASAAMGLKGDRRVFQPAKRRQPHQNISEDVKAAFDQINVP